MSSELGPMVYGQKEELIFLGREISEQRDYSESVAEKIDQEVRKLVNDAYTQAKELLTRYRTELDAIANRLLEVETLSREEFEKIFPPPVPHHSGTPNVNSYKIEGAITPSIFLIIQMLLNKLPPHYFSHRCSGK